MSGEAGSPASRLREVRKQLRLVLDDVEFEEDEDVTEYVEAALACAESAAVCLEGEDVLEGEDSITDAADVLVVDLGTGDPAAGVVDRIDDRGERGSLLGRHRPPPSPRWFSQRW